MNGTLAGVQHGSQWVQSFNWPTWYGPCEQRGVCHNDTGTTITVNHGLKVCNHFPNYTDLILVKPLGINFPLCPLSLMQVDEEKKVEAVREFYTNLGSFSIVDKLQIVSKY